MLKVLIAVLTVALIGSISYAQAGGWGHGPNIAGWEPAYKPVPNKPLDGVKRGWKDTTHFVDVNIKGLGKIATDTWNIIKRPFVEIWKFLTHPLDWLYRIVDKLWAQAADLLAKLALWLGIGLSAAFFLAVTSAIAIAVLILRPFHRCNAPVFQFPIRDRRGVPVADVIFDNAAEGKLAEAAIIAALAKAAHIEPRKAA